MWRSDNSGGHNNSNETVPLSITPREWEVEKVLFKMWGYKIIGYWYCNTSYSSARCHNAGDESSEEKGMEVSLGEEICGHRYIDTRQSSSINRGGHKSSGHTSQYNRHSISSNCGGCGCRSSLTRHSYYHNHGGYVDISRSRSQETSHFYYHNKETRVDVEGRGGYRYKTSHYSFYT